MASESETDSSTDEPSRRRKRGYRKLYCGSCWRDSIHVPLVRNKTMVVLLSVITFGLFLYFRTFKCRVCGHERSSGGDWSLPAIFFKENLLDSTSLIPRLIGRRRLPQSTRPVLQRNHSTIASPNHRWRLVFVWLGSMLHSFSAHHSKNRFRRSGCF